MTKKNSFITLTAGVNFSSNSLSVTNTLAYSVQNLSDKEKKCHDYDTRPQFSKTLLVAGE